jgi:hypothetical protein
MESNRYKMTLRFSQDVGEERWSIDSTRGNGWNHSKGEISVTFILVFLEMFSWAIQRRDVIYG